MRVFLVSDQNELDSVWRSKRKALARAREIACAGTHGITEARFRHCVKVAEGEAREQGTLFACLINALAGPGPYVTVEEVPVQE